MDKISIVTVCFNCQDCIVETLESIVKQTYTNKELIIVDGGSKDDTMKLVESFKNKCETHIVSEPDKGIFDAMNKSLKMASGEWIIFMNAGDLFVNECVLDNIFKVKYNNNVGVIYGDVIYKGVDKVYNQNKPFYISKNVIRQMGICHQTIFARLSLAKNIGFDTSYKYAADYNMIMQIYNCGYNFIHVDIAVAIYDMTGVSSLNPINQLKEISKICNAYKTMNYYYEYIVVIKRLIGKYLKFK